MKSEVGGRTVGERRRLVREEISRYKKEKRRKRDVGGENWRREWGGWRWEKEDGEGRGNGSRNGEKGDGGKEERGRPEMVQRRAPKVLEKIWESMEGVRMKKR